MKYKYRSTCRFPVLLELNNQMVQIRPNQVVESDVELNYEILKEIKSEPVKTRRPRRKKENNDG